VCSLHGTAVNNNISGKAEAETGIQSWYIMQFDPYTVYMYINTTAALWSMWWDY